MARTLNPQLFGQGQAPVIQVDASQAHGRKLREMEAQIDVINQKIDRLAQMQDQKVQQLQAGIKNMDAQIKLVSEGFKMQQAAILSKLNERRVSDAKTQELIDRHNQLVHQFETRIAQLQKVATEQEMKLMNYQSTYEEVLREIRNLRAR